MQKPQDITKGNLSALPEVHATSSGLKSLTTTITAEGIETCRRACGGHGYTLSSGLGTLFADYVGVSAHTIRSQLLQLLILMLPSLHDIQTLTAEGENFLLTQQTGRYLLKAYERLRRGSATPDERNIKYLENVDQLLEGTRGLPSLHH